MRRMALPAPFMAYIPGLTGAGVQDGMRNRSTDQVLPMTSLLPVLTGLTSSPECVVFCSKCKRLGRFKIKKIKMCVRVESKKK